MKTSLVTATLFAATLFTSTASAQESVLESLLTNLVGQALSASTVEIQNGVSQSIANVTYHFDLDDEVLTGLMLYTKKVAKKLPKFHNTRVKYLIFMLLFP